MDHQEHHKTFIEHLEELRHVLLRIVVVVMVLLPITFFFANDIRKLMTAHSCPTEFTLRYFTPMEPLFVQIKISLLIAFFIGLPYIAYTLWKFIVPALYPEERRRIKQLALASWLLFIAGSAFCFYFIIPAMMRFSLSMQSKELEAAIGLSNYISLVGMMLLGFGIMFQLPIVVFFLVLSGMIKLETIKKQRAVVLITILILSALLTPPDIFSQVMMAIPTYLLFEFSLIFSAIAIKTRNKQKDNDKNISTDTDLNPPPAITEQESTTEGTSTIDNDNNSANYEKYYRPHIVKRKLRSRSNRRSIKK